MTEVDEHPKTPVVVRELINKDKKQKKGVMRDIAILLLSMKTWLSWCYVAAPVCYYYLYSLMNYAGLKLGTYYPIGGFFSLIQ